MILGVDPTMKIMPFNTTKNVELGKDKKSMNKNSTTFKKYFVYHSNYYISCKRQTLVSRLKLSNTLDTTKAAL